MKKLTILSLFILHCISSLNAQEPKRGTVSDIDGNIYQTVIIGKYEWMAENLKTTTYNDGTKIPNVSESSAWIVLNSGAYCWYNNDSSIAVKYGALYNWYTVNTNNLCPEGWRVPSDDEWKYLEGYVDTKHHLNDSVWDKTGLRGYDVGVRLKASWDWRQDMNGTNNYNFSALPSGERLSRNGKFFVIGCNGFWWSSSEYGEKTALYRSIIYSYGNVMRYSHDKRFGFSVRCIRNK
ncbi:MAG: FISUMP domain-containing protein [Tenuifilaceae bacterium]